MAGAMGALLRAGLAVKLGHLRQAATSYMHDRAEQGRSTFHGYLIAAGLYAAAGIFMIAALLVAAAALFRWLTLTYGIETAFIATGAGFVVLTALCAAMAASALRPPRKSIPSLGSRMRVALRAGPPAKKAAKAVPAAAPSRLPADNRDHIASARNTATAVLRAPAAVQSRGDASQTTPLATRAGLAAAVGLMGWALARRYTQSGTPVQASRVRS